MQKARERERKAESDKYTFKYAIAWRINRTAYGESERDETKEEKNANIFLMQ